jgi:signal transduction histidine kinase
MGVSALVRLVRDSMMERPIAVRLPQRRRKAAWVLAVAGPTSITLGSRLLGSSVPPASALFSILLVVVVVALIGGWQPALTAVVVGLLAQEVFFTFPYGSLNDHKPAQLSVLVAFGIIGAVVGILVDDLTRLIEEQAALRRIAMLVATEAPNDGLFSAVAGEVGQLLRADCAVLGRYEPDGSMTVAAGWSRAGVPFPTGDRWSLDPENIWTVVPEASRPAGIHAPHEGSGPDAGVVRRANSHSAVWTPITVDGRSWGTIVVAPTVEESLPANTGARLAGFTDLLATAIANAESRGALAASRARIVGAADEARRRIERDLHDGAQQRLVSLGLELRAAQTNVPPELDELQRELSRVVDGLTSVLDELREMARGIHPAVLAEGGLGPALKTLGRRSPIPVELNLRSVARLPERVEVASYYVVSETLANAAKHARASVLQVDVEAANGTLRICVRDDGVGGADPARGSGLVGLRDRVESLGGSIAVESPCGAGTAVTVALPISAEAE